jgi:deoxyribodipyrimidine photo-lyase
VPGPPRRAIAWFRRDLRLDDNRMLAEASRSERVWPVLVADPELLRSLADATGRLAWYAASVRALDAELREHGSGLNVLAGPPERVLPAFAARVGAEIVVSGAGSGPAGNERDRRIAERISLRSVEDLRLFSPGEISTAIGGAQRFYAPFRKSLYARLDGEPWRMAAAGGDLRRLAPLGEDAEPYPDSPHSIALPAAGFPEAARILDRFAAERLSAYRDGRNRPDLDATSRLSPYLRVGAISVRALWRAAADAGEGTGARAWRSELAWREFFHHLQDPAERYPGIRWKEGVAADAALRAWREGRTGYPIVDAGMRQLTASGWMHNRLRLITASFLVKDLGIDPMRGASVFLEHLLDGDEAQNTGNWNWVAGTGADAAPYFRVFNPVAQGRRFDPRGAFVRHWLPELADVPDAWIHEPWLAPAAMRPRAYPPPLVDHAAARQEALARYARPGRRGG